LGGIKDNYFIHGVIIMFKPVFEKLEKEVSGDIAFNFVSEITQHHRIQASPGIRAAVSYVVETLKGYGLDAEVHKYPADGETYCWSSLQFKEWSCRDAELRLIQPVEDARFLARWSESKFSLIQRSYPTPGGCCEAEVVVLDKGEEDADYRRLDVKGKVVITNGDISRVHELAVERRGAIGIISDGTWVRPPSLLEGELDDALKYTSFWWSGDEKPCFGFVVTPRTGRWLRALVKKQKREPVKVSATVDSMIYPGFMENAVATIPGKTDEEVVVVAHICHPQPSANDNASGSAAAMEAARALARLIAMGTLQKPRRTIRFTLVPEMTGSYAYLAENEDRIPKMVAAINLDMVGEKQDICGSPLIVENTPEATPSFVNALLEAIFDEVKSEAGNLGGSARYALFKHAVTPFSGGSDHYIYSDPTVGVPSPMIIQWPDKFWHTSYDTLDKVDPEMLRKVALMTATYAYFIADAGPEEAIWLASEVVARWKRRLISYVQAQVTEILGAAAESDEPGRKLAEALSNLKKSIPYRMRLGEEAVKSVRRLSGEYPNYAAVEERLLSEIERTAKTELRQAEKAISDYADVKKLTPLPKIRKGRLMKLEKEAAGIVPHRVFKGPVSIRPWMRKLSSEDRESMWRLGKEHEEIGILGTLAMYWADGERSLLDISDLVELEAGRTDLKYIVSFFGFLRKMGLVEYA
jgi:aminopeptidase YwaD